MNHHHGPFPNGSDDAFERDRLEQELLELHFGCHENSERLEARLAAEPALRALQAKVLQQASVLEQAVRPDQPQLALREPAASERRFGPWRWLRHPVGRLTAAAAIAASTVLGFFVAERLAHHRVVRLERERLHLTVSAPKAVPAGASWSFTVQANDLRGEAAACRVRWQAFDKAGAMLAANETAVTAGTATVVMPADLRMPERIEVVASHATDEVRQVFSLSTAAAAPLVHVTTDRPVYRPGEPVFVRAVVLDRITRLPLPQTLRLQAQLLDAKGAPITTDQDFQAPAGVGSFLLALPADSNGGPHQVRVQSVDGLFPSETADVVVRAFHTPQLKKTIVLDRISYSPGARGSALVTAERLSIGGGAAGAQAKAVLLVDGTEVWSEQRPLGVAGDATFRFTVPAQVEKGAARFVATITDGGIVETEWKPFVVPTGKVLFAAFPEGGELIAGIANNLYFECTDPLGRPIDGIGELLDAQDRPIARFRTAHQGRGKIDFVPRAGAGYRVRLHGQDEPFALPAVQEQGIALRLAGEDIGVDAPLRVSVAGRGDGPWLLGVFCRGVLVGQTTLRPDERGELQAAAEVPLPKTATGVLRATVFDRSLRPIAERLVRRLASERLDVALVPKHATRLPGETQEVTVRTTDEAGQPQRAVVGMSVTDLAAVSLGSEPRIGLVDQAMLFADVERMENLGDFFLGGAENARNVDLLLGTRGWRRFVWRNDAAAQAVIAARGDAAAGVLAREGFSHTPQVASNLAAAKAATMAASAEAHHANRAWKGACRWSVFSVALLLLAELGAAVARLLAKAHAPGQLVGAVATVLAVGIVLQGANLGPQPVIYTLYGEATEPAPDFVGSGSATPVPSAAPISLPLTWDFDTVTAQAALVPEAIYLGLGGAEPGASVIDLNGFGQGNGRFLTPSADPMTVGLVTRFPLDPASELGETGFLVRRFAAREDQEQPSYFLSFERNGVQVDLQSWRQRQYAHQHTPSDDRRDFTATILWNTLVPTEANGEATVTFATSDAVTTWLVQADAHTLGATGRLGTGTTTFATQQPLQVEAKLPDEVSAGDRLLLPIALVVADPTIKEATLTANVGTGLQLAAEAPSTITLVDGRGRALLPITTGTTLGDVAITIDVRAGRFHDRLRHTLRIAERGFPHRRSLGGSVEAGASSTARLVVPDDALPGSGRITLKVYPSPISALTEGLAGILQEPHGCFEQASSSNYPNTLVLTLLDATGDDVPLIAARARELLPRGYRKITGYECKQKGYEWFGADPGHEALTAYGLLQFHDMANVHDVDPDMVARTQQWLLGRRDGKGNYPHQGTDHHSFGGRSTVLTNAYVTYALLQAGTKAAELAVELDALVARATTKDPYELALIACALHLAGRPEATLARTRLAELQKPDGSLHGTTTSITQSGGQDLIVETTGFAVLAWLVDPAHAGHARSAIEFVQRCRSAQGTFGATQATITALRALTAYATANRTMRTDGTLRIFDGDVQVAERAFGANENQALTFELWDKLPPGEHTLRLEVEGGGGPLPWACDVAYHAEQPASDPGTQVALSTTLRAATVAEGATVALDVTLKNTTGEVVPTPIAILGLPAGLEVPTRVLEDLQKANAFAFWELKGRELILYWRELAPAATQSLTIDLVARTPGRSTAPASRAWLYYTPEQRHWLAPLDITVTPAK